MIVEVSRGLEGRLMCMAIFGDQTKMKTKIKAVEMKLSAVESERDTDRNTNDGIKRDGKSHVTLQF